MKGGRIRYSARELAWIYKARDLPRRQAHSLFQARFGRTDISFDNFKSLYHRKGWKTGRLGHFVPGQVAWNKGKKMPRNACSASTQFKKGHLPHNTRYLGHERISKDGYVEISVDEKNPHTGYERRYVLKHRWLWEKKNGRVPAGMCLKALDGNKLNTDPENWTPIPRAMLPLMNGFRGLNYQTAPASLKPVILALTRLRAARAQRVKKRKDTTPIGERADKAVVDILEEVQRTRTGRTPATHAANASASRSAFRSTRSGIVRPGLQSAIKHHIS